MIAALLLTGVIMAAEPKAGWFDDTILTGPLPAPLIALRAGQPVSDQTGLGFWIHYEPLCDEFDGTALNPDKWTPNNPGWAGRPPGWFDPGNVRVQGGRLRLVARAAESPEPMKLRGYHTWSTAAVKSRSLVRYGYFEVKAKAMKSHVSSAFWFYADTPERWTEIDVFEIGGGAPGFERTLNMNAHVFRTPLDRTHRDAHRDWIAPFSFAEGDHVYGFEWSEYWLVWFLDGHEIRRLENTDWHQPLHLNFDSETMPDWFGLPDDFELPGEFSIEYVRTWKQKFKSAISSDTAWPIWKGISQTQTPEQAKQAILPFDHPERDAEVFTGGSRAGIPIRELNEGQRKRVIHFMRTFLSSRGKRQCDAIALQDGPDGLGKYYLAFFGEPGPDRDWAWRISEHHITLVHVEMRGDTPRRFGPILLGADPPTLWGDDEDLLIALYGALTPEERAGAVRAGKAESSRPIGDAGILVKGLGAPARKALEAMLRSRLSYFSPSIKERIESMLVTRGGLDAMKIAFWGEATKRCRDGGRWDFKLGSDEFLIDYENTRGHIHLAMKGRLRD